MPIRNHQSEIIRQKSQPFVLVGVLAILLLAGPAVGQFPTNNDPTSQIRFNTATGADAKRTQLTDYIWSGGLPTSTLPTVTTGITYPTANLSGLNQSLVASVDMLDANVMGMDSISYMLHPATANANSNRLVIVHHGHVSGGASLSLGVDSTANALLQAGYTVDLMQMPLCGWNTSYTVTPPGGTQVIIAGTGSNAHDNMFAQLAPLIGGGVFSLFLEPVVQNINYFEQTPNAKDVSMVGLSGGGWTTSMIAAIDPRVKLSIPIAGSAPLYIRNLIHTGGDTEQSYTPLYDERIASDGSGGGVATWLEDYALGAYGAGRRQIMVTNEYEPVGLFPGTWVTDTIDGASVKGLVTGTVANLGAGQWSQVYDTSQSDHEISPWTLNNVILPALETPEPSTLVLAVTGLLALGLYAWRRRKRLMICDS